MHTETSLFFLLLTLPTHKKKNNRLEEKKPRLRNCKFLPTVLFLNLIIYFSLLDSKSPVRMLCFKTMLMIFLSSLNSVVEG